MSIQIFIKNGLNGKTTIYDVDEKDYIITPFILKYHILITFSILFAIITIAYNNYIPIALVLSIILNGIGTEYILFGVSNRVNANLNELLVMNNINSN